jgi:hypothetical protein
LRARGNTIHSSTKYYFVFHKQPIIQNNRVSEQHKISIKTPC